MPTVPRKRPEPPVPELYKARPMAESFGADAERYDQARPGYPDALVAQVVAESPGLDVLDVGTGTGIAARQFQAAGCTVLGVEPDARMAEFARARGLAVEVATFEAWDPAGRTFDTVIAAQSWHWIDPFSGAAKAAQVLRPSGRLAIFGHVYEPPIEVAEPFAAAYRRVVPDSPFANLPARRLLDTYQAAYAKIADTARPNNSTNPNGGDSTGSSPTPATNGWPYCPPPAASPDSTLTSGPTSSMRSAPPSTLSAEPSRCTTPLWRPPRHTSALRDLLGRVWQGRLRLGGERRVMSRFQLAPAHGQTDPSAAGQRRCAATRSTPSVPFGSTYAPGASGQSSRRSRHKDRSVIGGIRRTPTKVTGSGATDTCGEILGD